MASVSVFEQQRIKKRKEGIPRLIELAGTRKVLLVMAGFFSIIAVAAQITPFVTIYFLVRELIAHIGDIGSIDTAYVWRLSWLTVAGVGVYGVFTYAGGMCSHIAAFNILYEIRVALAGKLSRMPMGYFTDRTKGGIKKVLNEDVERIELFVAHHIVDIVQAVALPTLSLAVLFWLDWRLAIGVLVPLPLALWAQYTMYSEEGLKLYEEWQKRLSAMNGTIVEYVRGMPVVKVFNQTVGAFKRFAADVYAYRDLTLHWIQASVNNFSVFLTLLSSSAVFILPIVILLVRSVPETAYGDFVSTVFLFLYIGMGIAVPMYKLMTLMSLLVQIKTGLSEIDGVLDEEEIPEARMAARPLDSSVEFRGVSFAYKEQTVLDDVSFTVPPGTVTALVGPSGGGKTTIANLIGRFWDVRKGGVLIGGVDVRNMSVNTLNDTVATVFQDVFLFFDTIEENIRMGNSSASFDDVASAAKAARIHEFIETLPQGYQTMIGEGGTYLSGGEQQRISLARVILKDAPIVVLDEATAYADPENEARIQETLSMVLRNKTVIIIAHRLYTITDVDQILVVNEGWIEERGGHAELLDKKGLYRRMWETHARARDWNMDTEEGVSE